MRLELAPSAQMLRVYEWLDSDPWVRVTCRNDTFIRNDRERDREKWKQKETAVRACYKIAESAFRDITIWYMLYAHTVHLILTRAICPTELFSL